MAFSFCSSIIINVKNGFSIIYIDDDNYIVGYFEKDKLNGWGAHIYKEDENEYVLKGYFKDGKLDGVGKNICYTPNGPISSVGLFKKGEYLSPDIVKSTFPSHPYEWIPHMNGENNPRSVIYYGELNKEGYPVGFGMMELEGKYYYTHYDEEGYRTGMFYYPEGDNYKDYLYDIKKTPLSKKEWVILSRAGVMLNAKKIAKKYAKK